MILDIVVAAGAVKGGGKGVLKKSAPGITGPIRGETGAEGRGNKVA